MKTDNMVGACIDDTPDACIACGIKQTNRSLDAESDLLGPRRVSCASGQVHHPITILEQGREFFLIANIDHCRLLSGAAVVYGLPIKEDKTIPKLKQFFPEPGSDQPSCTCDCYRFHVISLHGPRGRESQPTQALAKPW
jgi:hypothetical protein